MTVKIKICGITCRTDAQEAVRLGADYIGIIVNIAGSLRSVTIDQAVEISAGIPSPVVLMEGPVTAIHNALQQINPFAVQLIGSYAAEDIRVLKKETNAEIWTSVHVPTNGAGSDGDCARHIDAIHKANIDAIVLDTMVPGLKGGTGKTCDWDAAANIVKDSALPVFLAGGLTPDNVARSITQVQPFGVDVSSGVETSPGKKDQQKILEFIQQANVA
mgnify:CR=1 FL=1